MHFLLVFLELPSLSLLCSTRPSLLIPYQHHNKTCLSSSLLSSWPKPATTATAAFVGSTIGHMVTIIRGVTTNGVAVVVMVVVAVVVAISNPTIGPLTPITNKVFLVILLVFCVVMETLPTITFSLVLIALHLVLHVIMLFLMMLPMISLGTLIRKLLTTWKITRLPSKTPLYILVTILSSLVTRMLFLSLTLVLFILLWGFAKST